MKTVTIEIINDKAIELLKDLELLQLIRINYEDTPPNAFNRGERYKGAMSKQPLDEIDKQLNELRSEWE